MTIKAGFDLDGSQGLFSGTPGAFRPNLPVGHNMLDPSEGTPTGRRAFSSYTLMRQLGQRLEDEANDAGNGWLYQQFIVTESPIQDIALPFYNNTAGTVSIDGLWIRTSDTLGDGGAKGAWVGLTHSGGTATATATPLVVAARTSADRPSVGWSDMTSFSNTFVPRVDGGSGYVYEVRAHILAGASTFSRSYADFRGWLSDAFSDTRGIRSRRTAVTRANSLAAGTDTALAAAADLAHCFIIGWKYRTPYAGLTIGVLGDSNEEATTSVGTLNEGGWAWQMVRQLRAKFPGVPIELANYGWGTQASPAIINRGRDILATNTQHVPSMLFARLNSSNDGTPTSNTLLTSRRGLVDLRELADARMVPLIPITPLPYDALAISAAEDAFRVQWAEDLRDSAVMGQQILDCDLIASAGDSPASYKRGFSTDLTHLNTYGAKQVGAYGAGAVQALMPIRL